uniref:Uncharacterized protein n=1 Tax=Alexandrium catenella TaxID=2925 RepID=A0A7S1MJ62_ALECA
MAATCAMRRRRPAMPMALALARLALAVGEEGGSSDPADWNRSAFRFPGVPMAGDVCECLNWKKLYDAGRIWCGEGLEFNDLHNGTTGVTKEELMPLITAPNVSGYQHYEHICHRLFKKLDTNRCMGIGQYAWDPNDWLSHSSWCYVPFSCKKLNGGDRLNSRPVSWKKCERGKDPLFQELAPKDLFKWMSEQGRFLGAIGTMFRYTYPALRPEIWFDIKKKLKRREFKRMPQMLLSAMKHNMPIVIETMPITQALFAQKKVIWNNTLSALVCNDAQKRGCFLEEDTFDAKSEL